MVTADRGDILNVYRKVKFKMWYRSRVFTNSFCFAAVAFWLSLSLPTARAISPSYLQKINQIDTPRAAVNDEALWSDRVNILQGVEASIEYLQSPQAEKAYQQFEGRTVSRELVEQSLQRFYDILRSSMTPEEVDRAIRQEFTIYRSTGFDGRGSVKFTGYFQPSYEASRTKTKEFQYPVYYLPPDFADWKKPHPTRVELEGYNGLGGASTLLDGYELAFLRNRFDVFMIHLQGSAILEFENEDRVSIGFAAGTAHPFRGISGEFLKKYNVPWSHLDTFFSSNPQLFNSVISKNNRFIFFQEKRDLSPIGSLGIPVVPGRSIATDKTRFPPGALGVIHTKLPKFSASGRVELQTGYRIVLDHDTGSAIKGAGRVDLYVGAGPQAQRLASNVYSYGELYYLILRNPPQVASAAISQSAKRQG